MRYRAGRWTTRAQASICGALSLPLPLSSHRQVGTPRTKPERSLAACICKAQRLLHKKSPDAPAARLVTDCCSPAAPCGPRPCGSCISGLSAVGSAVVTCMRLQTTMHARVREREPYEAPLAFCFVCTGPLVPWWRCVVHVVVPGTWFLADEKVSTFIWVDEQPALSGYNAPGSAADPEAGTRAADWRQARHQGRCIGWL